MSKRLTKRLDVIKNKKLCKTDRLFIGLDVHKSQHHVAFWLNGRLVKTTVMPADNVKVAQMLEPYRVALKKIVYEAGPTGFHLARYLLKCGFPVEVIAPSEVPEKRNSKAKTDRLDCRKLASYSAKEILKSIHIPSFEQETARQLSRHRDQLIAKRKRAKQQIKSLLLQYGIAEPAGLKNFSKASISALKNMNLCQELGFCIESLINELDYYNYRLKNVEKKLQQLLSSPAYSKAYEIALSHPGIGPTTARQYLLEIPDPHRFNNAAEVASYLGLCPKVKQSGDRRRDGNIVMTSKATLRANLIESSWAWIRQDRHAHSVFIRILHNTGESKKAITAMARRLAIHLWKMLCNEEYFRKEQVA